MNDLTANDVAALLGPLVDRHDPPAFEDLADYLAADQFPEGTFTAWPPPRDEWVTAYRAALDNLSRRHRPRCSRRRASAKS